HIQLLGGLQIDDQLERRRLLEWELGGVFAFDQRGREGLESALLARYPAFPRRSVDFADSGPSALAAGTRPHAPKQSSSDRGGARSGHVFSLTASRKPDKNSSRCCGFRYGSGR